MFVSDRNHLSSFHSVLTAASTTIIHISAIILLLNGVIIVKTERCKIEGHKKENLVKFASAFRPRFKESRHLLSILSNFNTAHSWAIMVSNSLKILVNGYKGYFNLILKYSNYKYSNKNNW